MHEPLDRRAFARRVTWGVAAVAAGSSVEIAADGPVLPAAAQDAPPPGQRPPLPLLILGRLLEEYPSEQYTEAALEGLLQDIRGDLARSKALSDFPLSHEDQPAFLFAGSPRCRLVLPSESLPPTAD